MSGRALIAWACAASLGCALLPGGVPQCPGPLAPTDAMGANFVARERLRWTHGERTLRLDLVVQKHGDSLVLVAFDPLGPKLFSLVQRGQELEVEATPMLPVPPENVLRDLHRARFGVAEPGVSVTREGEELVVRNPACGSEARFTRVSERGLP